MLKIKHFLIDVEGTLVEGKSFDPIAGAKRWLRKARQMGKSFRVVTNNTTHSAEELRALLLHRGFDISSEELYTCLSNARERLKRDKIERCFIIGSPAMERYFRREGFEVNSGGGAQTVLVGLDEKLTLQKLKIATRLILQDGARLIAMHKGRLYINRQGEISFSSGAIVSALEFACRVKAAIVGKPARSFFRNCIKDWEVPPREVMMISDDPLSDLAGAKRLGMKTAFVLSGAYPRREILSQVNHRLRPDLVLKRISELQI